MPDRSLKVFPFPVKVLLGLFQLGFLLTPLSILLCKDFGLLYLLFLASFSIRNLGKQTRPEDCPCLVRHWLGYLHRRLERFHVPQYTGQQRRIQGCAAALYLRSSSCFSFIDVLDVTLRSWLMGGHLMSMLHTALDKNRVVLRILKRCCDRLISKLTSTQGVRENWFCMSTYVWMHLSQVDSPDRPRTLLRRPCFAELIDQKRFQL